MSNEIMVSISCLVYNHGKYLRQCLDGMVHQKTNFKYEILVHDDASTDDSAQIIREYEEKYPDLVKPIYQTENQFSRHASIQYKYQYPRAKGKYLALCEGDDYWCDEHKLQRQVEVMEANEDCVFSVHRVQAISESGELLGHSYPDYLVESGYIDGQWILQKLFEGAHLPFQTSSHMYRAHFLTQLDPIPDFMLGVISGDLMRTLYFADLGTIHFIDETMSRYRVNSVGSWSSRTNQDIAYKTRWLENCIELYRKFDVYTQGKYHEGIEETVKRRTFALYKNTFNVKAMMSPEYRSRFNAMPFAERACYTMVRYLPFTKGLVHKLRAFVRSR